MVLDVAPVLAQVHRYVVGAGIQRLPGGFHRIGVSGASRLAQGCYMVDIHSKKNRHR